ncbi:AraC family transcriptional regulator [Paraburkholderia kururiensis]|uniref:AraC family transcriptional regulator n=1 Tax=Paraburkholderia kururiensis TaxID=984307 RepID=UPI0003471A1D|nr:AraC family transcriptional regulator [Paraburkholderia kururiensis]
MMESRDPTAPVRAVYVLEQRHEGSEVPWRAEPRAQLIRSGSGVLTVRTESALWVAPPGHAVWVLPGVLHRLSSTAPLALHTLYAEGEPLLVPGAAAVPPVAFVPAQGCVVTIDRLTDELLPAAAIFGLGYTEEGAQARLVQVILDRVPQLAVMPLSLFLPRDPRIQRVADMLVTNPADSRVLDELAEAAGVTARTAARLFVRETGLTFGQWRQQLRLLVALEKLGAGASVTQVALEVGYNDVSSFIAVFRDVLGETPARYFR